MARNSMVGLGAEQVRELARTGAEVTVRNLRAEISAIERAFPELSRSRGRSVGAMRTVTAAASAVRIPCPISWVPMLMNTPPSTVTLSRATAGAMKQG